MQRVLAGRGKKVQVGARSLVRSKGRQGGKSTIKTINYNPKGVGRINEGRMVPPAVYTQDVAVGGAYEKEGKK